jgi:hypothetical protein
VRGQEQGYSQLARIVLVARQISRGKPEAGFASDSVAKSASALNSYSISYHVPPS